MHAGCIVVLLAVELVALHRVVCSLHFVSSCVLFTSWRPVGLFPLLQHFFAFLFYPRHSLTSASVSSTIRICLSYGPGPTRPNLAPGSSAGTQSGPSAALGRYHASWTNVFLRFGFYPPGYFGAPCLLDVSIDPDDCDPSE